MTGRLTARRCLFAMLLGVACTLTKQGVVFGDAPRVFRLTIASQPLAQALQEFARQSGVQVIFFSELTEGYRAPALEGQYTLSQALTRLLTNTPLAFRIVNTRTVKVESGNASGDATAPPGDGSRWLEGHRYDLQ